MLHKLTSHVYVSDYETYRDRPRLGYILGSQKSLLIDAGTSAAHLKEVLDEINTLNCPKPEAVILTHWHWDHVYGLHACDFPSLCSEKTQHKLKEMSLWKWDDASRLSRLQTGADIEFCDEHIQHEYEDLSLIKVKEASETYFDEVNLDCGDVHLEIFELETDHSEDNTFIFVQEDKVLFVGDAYSYDYHHGLPHYTQAKLSRLIQKLESLDFKIIVHGHDEIMTKPEILSFLKEELKKI